MRDQRLSNEASLDSSHQDVLDAKTESIMYEHRHRASDTEYATLRAKLHKVNDDLDLNEQKQRHLARKIRDLKIKLNWTSSPNPGQIELEIQVRELTSSLPEAELAKLIT